MTLSLGVLSLCTTQACSYVQSQYEETDYDLTTTQVATATGAVLGAGLGAIVGSQSGDAGAGLAIGTAAGALSGALIGNELQGQEDEILAQQEVLTRQEEEIRRQRRELQDLKGQYGDGQYVIPQKNRSSLSFGEDDAGARAGRSLGSSLGASSGRVEEESLGASFPPARARLSERADIDDSTSQYQRRLPPVAEGLPSQGRAVPFEETESISKAPQMQVTRVKPQKRLIDSSRRKVTASASRSVRANSSQCHSAESEALRAKNATSDADKLFYLRRALRLCSTKPEFHVEIGRVYAALGRLEDAKSEFSKALELDPDNKDAQDELTLIMVDSQTY